MIDLLPAASGDELFWIRAWKSKQGVVPLGEKPRLVATGAQAGPFS